MVWPDSQIKASKGPAVSMLCCWMIRAFHRLGKTLCRNWQTSLFPVRYGEQPLSMDWAWPPGTAREATNSMCICKYWTTSNPNLLHKLLLRDGLVLASARPVQKLYHSWEQVVLENKPVLKRQ